MFGGSEITTPINDLKLKMEISSDSYEDDNFLIKKTPKSNINFGLNYNIGDSLSISSNYINGNEIGVQVNIKLNPETSSVSNYLENAPQAVLLSSN